MNENKKFAKIRMGRTWIGIWTAIICVAFLGAVYYYNLLLDTQIPADSDNAGSTLAIYDENILGGLDKTSGNLQIFMIFSRLSYALLGYSEMAMRIVFCMNFFCMLLASFYLIVKNKDRKIIFLDVLLIFYLVILQGTSGPAQIQISKFHTNSTICFLIMLGFLQAYQIYKKKRYLILVVLTVVFSLVQLDYLLTIVVIIAPLLLYGFLYMINSKKCKNYLQYLIIIIPAGLLVIRIIDKLFLTYMGKSLFTFSAWGSGRVFADIEGIKENIVLFLEGLLNMFNCNAGGTELISLGTAVWFIRIAILFAMMIKLASVLYRLIVFFKEVDMIDGLLAVSCFVTIFVYLITPQEDVISMRYCNVLLFALPVLFLRDIGRQKIWEGNICVFQKNISRDTFAAVGVFLLILGMVRPLPIERTHMKNDDLAYTIRENDLENGIAPYWAGSVISLLTDEESIVQAVSMQPFSIQPFLGTISIYDDKAASFNFIIEDKEITDAYDNNVFGVSRENIIATYGEPSRQIAVGEEKNIYVYDYDVRSVPENISYRNNDWIYSDGAYGGQIVPEETVTFGAGGFQIGEYYIIIEGSNLEEDIELYIDGQKAEFVSNKDQGSLKFYFEIDQYKDTHQIVVKNSGEQQRAVENLKIVKIREAIDLSFDNKIVSEDSQLGISENVQKSDKFKVSAGYYKLVFYGKNIDNLSVSVDGNVSEFFISESGKARAVGTFSCMEDTEIQVYVNADPGEKVLLDNVSIEKVDE